MSAIMKSINTQIFMILLKRLEPQQCVELARKRLKEFLIRGIYDMTQRFKDAIKFIKEKHFGQVRKFDKKPYIIHPIRVANIVKKFKPASKNIDDLLIASLLHDTKEDTNATSTEIREKFGNLVSSLVTELTSDKDKIEKLGKEQYLSQKMTEELTDYGLVLKLADRLQNTGDFEIADPKFVKKYAKETRGILNQLQNRKLTSTQKKLVDAIDKNIKKYE